MEQPDQNLLETEAVQVVDGLIRVSECSNSVDDSSRDRGSDVQVGYIGSYWDYPDELKDNEYITSGYKIGYKGLKNGFRTMFMVHNETVNVWTHFLGKLFFLGVLIFMITAYP